MRTPTKIVAIVGAAATVVVWQVGSAYGGTRTVCISLPAGAVRPQAATTTVDC